MMTTFVVSASLLLATLIYPYPTIAGAPQDKAGPTKTLAVAKAVAPLYPPCALAARTFGLVRIDAHVDADGTTVSAKFVGADGKAVSGALPHAGLECLRRAAEAAARRWAFAPSGGREGGRMVRLNFRFVIINEEKADEDLSPVFRPPYEVEVRGLVPSVITRPSE